MKKIIKCPQCEDDHTHFMATIRVRSDYRGTAKSLKINDRCSIEIDVPYLSGSVENIHLVFRCRNKHFFIESYNDDQSQIFTHNNPLIMDLEQSLNKYTRQNDQGHTKDADFFAALTKFARENGAVGS